MIESIYTKPKVCKSKNAWYVWFRIKGVKQPFKFKKGINRFKNLTEREREANALAKALHRKLKDGWLPEGVIAPTLDHKMSFIAALDFGLAKKHKTLDPKSYSGYKGTIESIKIAIGKLCIHLPKVTEVKRIHIKLILEKASAINDWSNNSRNKNLSYLSAVLSELIEWDIIEHNPAHKISLLPVAQSNYHKTASDEQHDVIKEYLSAFHPYFYNYIRALYHTGARPKELLQIQLHMIDLSNREINLPPIVTKGGLRYRDITINNHLFSMLDQMELEKFPSDFYLFGAYDYNHKHRAAKKLDFIPGPIGMKRDTSTKRWKKIVKDGLGINITQYSYKHKGGDDKLIAGVDFDSIREQYGHTNKKMTKTYVKKIKGVYKNDIIKNSPKF